MSYSTSQIEGVNVTATYSVSSANPEIPGAPFAVGTRTLGKNNAEFVFVSNAEATAQVVGDVGFLNATSQGTFTRVTTTNGLRGQEVAVAVSAIPATTGGVTSYGWVQTKGPCAAISVLASCAANVRLNTVATAGALDDDGTATTKQVQGIYLTTARAASAGTAPGILGYPFVDATL